MKTTNLFPLFFCLLATTLFSQSNIQQSLSINSTGAAAAASAQLDVSATDKGMLVPRMTTAQRTAIASPATGLLVFDTTTGSFFFYNGTAWMNLSSPKVLADADNDTKIQVEKNPDEDIIRFDLGGTENMVLRKNPSGTVRLEILDGANFNTFIGSQAGAFNSSGQQNTATGFAALNENTTGNYNTANGLGTLSYNNGSGNSAVGAYALYYNTTGFSNVAIGREALHLNTLRSNLVAVGDSALYHNGVGVQFAFHAINNTAVGSKALMSNTIGSSNTALGYQALYSNTDGANNTANGYTALYSNTEGSSNTALGYQALYSNTYGFNNTANGRGALYSNTGGIGNTANGKEALYNSTGSNNTANGESALYSNTDGIGNTANGKDALYSNTTGNLNTAIGRSASFTTNNLDNTSCFGYYSGKVSNASNRIEIGNTSVSWIGGQVGWMTYSDARIKTQVQENVPGLAFITKLRPVTYHLDIHKQNDLCFSQRDGQGKKDIGEWEGKYDIELKQMTGFIAQEVEAAAKAVGYDFSGVEKGADEVGMYSVKYAEFVVPLVKGMQEQQQEIKTLKAENAALKAQVSAQAAQLDKISAALQGAGIAVEK